MVLTAVTTVINSSDGPTSVFVAGCIGDAFCFPAILILLIFYGIYVGKMIIQKKRGILLMYFNPVLLVCSILAMVLFHLQILQEERFLSDTFGREYQEYRAHTCRYFGKKIILFRKFPAGHTKFKKI